MQEKKSKRVSYDQTMLSFLELVVNITLKIKSKYQQNAGSTLAISHRNKIGLLDIVHIILGNIEVLLVGRGGVRSEREDNSIISGALSLQLTVGHP